MKKDWNKIRIGVIAGSLVGFFVILYFVVTKETLLFDTIITEAVYAMRNDALTAVFKPITYLGNWQSITVLCLFLLLIGTTRKKYGIPLAVSAILVTLLNKIVKVIVARPRPDLNYHLIEQGGYSFTSGHSITSLVVFGMLIYLIRKYVQNRKLANALTAICCIPLILIGLSRIYLGVHYPTDVLGGWLLGIAVLTGCICIMELRQQ